MPDIFYCLISFYCYSKTIQFDTIIVEQFIYSECIRVLISVCSARIDLIMYVVCI